jgi:hypothetical protein
LNINTYNFLEIIVKAFWIGVVLTLGYLSILGFAMVALDLKLMTSWSEMGDFLAGVFSPIAFFWLVLGYLQQQKELQQNTKALELQAEELKNSVEQYRDMVSVAREQLVAEEQSMAAAREEREKQFKPKIKAPQIMPAVSSGGYYQYQGILEIAGDVAESLLIRTVPPFGPFNLYSRHSIEVGTTTLGTGQKVHKDSLPKTLDLTITYKSRLGKNYTDKYVYILGEEGRYAIIDNEES